MKTASNSKEDAVKKPGENAPAKQWIAKISRRSVAQVPGIVCTRTMVNTILTIRALAGLSECVDGNQAASRLPR
jgi:hypothetical protein